MVKHKLNVDEKCEERVNEKGLFTYANSYYSSFSELLRIDPDTTRFHPVLYYLVAHSLELMMKALLRKNNYKLEQLKSLGHDLETILMEIKRLNLITLSAKEEAILRSLNLYYSVKQFEYFQRGYKKIPNLYDVDMIALSLLEKTRKAIAY